MRVLGVCFGMVAAAWISAGLAGGQPGTAAGPHFTSASVRVVQGQTDEFRTVLGTVIQGEVQLTNANLMECLRFAFGITNNFQIAGPDWLQSPEYRFNVIGKTAPTTPADRIHVMLQNLLTERFRMTIHRESRELAFLALTVSPKGLKIKPAKSGSDASGNAQIPGKIASNSMSIAQLTTLLSHFAGQPVLDMTGLQGWFDLKLEWKPTGGPEDDAAASPAANSAANSAIYAAIEDQLGLVLEHRMGPIEVIVVDRAEKTPAGN
jgi:uncharacterized protein (TIGR03435 family)